MISSWHELQENQKRIEEIHLKDLFEADPKRFKKFSLQIGDLLFDYSKQRINDETLSKLCALALECQLETAREDLFLGKPINSSENRPALHIALRSSSLEPIRVNGLDIKAAIQESLKKIEQFSERIRSGSFLGATEKKITDILCLGIGGSELGPKMVCKALEPFKTTEIKLHFISNVDGQSLKNILKKLNPKNTLCIINSKTFTTSETMTNANSVKEWFQVFDTESDVRRHLVAVTANVNQASAFGILEEHIFEFWDWVGGRFSIWSVVGLPIAIMFGMQIFKDFLLGAEKMDKHFKNAPLSENMPVIMALLGVWNTNFLGCHTHAILPYEDGLADFPAYMQQLEMESNGKMVAKDGKFIQHATAPIVWGGVGCNGQHAYMQLLHQGTRVVPADFLVAVKSDHPYVEQQKLLVANCLSQSKALMEGSIRVTDLAKFYPGNRPSSTLIFKSLSPEVLGSLIALYEHKVFTQGIIWGINSFDQWGVELGKTMVKSIITELDKQQHLIQTDKSTEGLISFYQQHR